jgi:hypothetical protein
VGESEKAVKNRNPSDFTGCKKDFIFNCIVTAVLYLSLSGKFVHGLVSVYERSTMARPDSTIADRAPSGDALTPYDNDHLATYLRLLDADADGADWSEVTRIVLGIDPEQEPERARTAWESHLERAKWMTSHGYKGLVRRDSQGQS